MPGVKIGVTDAANAALNINVNPSKVVVSRKFGLDLEWSLHATGGWEWDADGITIHTKPPPPYSGWSGNQPIRVGDVYQAIAPPNTGTDPILYQYNANLKKGGNSIAKHRIDPDTGDDPPGGGPGDDRR